MTTGQTSKYSVQGQEICSNGAHDHRRGKCQQFVYHNSVRTKIFRQIRPFLMKINAAMIIPDYADSVISCATYAGTAGVVSDFSKVPREILLDSSLSGLGFS